MKKGSTLFLKFVLIIIGLVALALMLWEPHLEGRNVGATIFQIYFKDPFLAYAYIASIPFFVAIYQAFKLLGYIEQNKVFSLSSVKTLRMIKYCAMTLIGFILGAEAYFNIVQRSNGEDIAGGVVIGLVMIFLSAVIATAAAVFERLLQNAVDIKIENDLTV